jgi:ArsR family metal-binding transcriptional regulator
VDENFQQLMHQLGEAINDAVMTSGDVDAALDKVRSSGIDVFLVLEATICVRRRDGEPVNMKIQKALPLGEEEVDLNAEDLQFLKRLRISVE